MFLATNTSAVEAQVEENGSECVVAEEAIDESGEEKTPTEKAADRKDDDIAEVADIKRERIILQSWL